MNIPKLQIVSWNIRHGGGAGERNAQVISTLSAFDADLLVVTEFRAGAGGLAIMERLRASGYHLSHPPVAQCTNSVLIAARDQIKSPRPLASHLANERHLWRVDAYGISVVGVYLPLGKAKLAYWEAILDSARGADAPAMFCGDFNTGSNELDKDPRGERFVGPEYMNRMAEQGFVDLWRRQHADERDYSWFSPQAGNGFRLDHAFAAPWLATRVLDCRFDHAPRLAGVSDHSAIVADIVVSRPPLAATSLSLPIQQKPMELAKCRSVSASQHNKLGCIYAFYDTGCPGVVKIGKDEKWPQRFRQAQSHTPRGMVELGRWIVSGDGHLLSQEERSILSLFPRETSTPGREWVRAEPDEVVKRVSAHLGSPMAYTPIDRLRPYDDWRDYVRPPHSKKPRRIWIGYERVTHRLKIIHSPHIELFKKFCPTYSRLGISWLEAWEVPAGCWAARDTLHPLDEKMVACWADLVTNWGYGTEDLRVGWLREGIKPNQVRDCLRAERLQVNRGVVGWGSSQGASDAGLEPPAILLSE